MSIDTVTSSKFLSLLLRHKPEEVGLVLDAEGWAVIEDIVQLTENGRTPLTRVLIETITKTSDKKRFVISDDGERIRANQGHSIAVDLRLEPSHPPVTLYHGTATRFLESIMRGGLVKGRRQHVHLSPDEDTALKVGQRHGRPVILRVAAQATACGVRSLPLTMEEQADVANEIISRSLKTLIRGLTQDNLTEIYEGYKTLFKEGPAAIPQIRDAISKSKWTKVKYPNEIRYITGLVNLIHDLDEAEAQQVTSELKGNGCDPAVAGILDSIVSFKLNDYVQYDICGVKIFEHKRLVTRQNVKQRLEQWLKPVPFEDLDEIERIYILRKDDMEVLGSYKPVLYRINLAWDNPSPRWSPMSWLNNFIIESTLYHEIGHHVHRHTFGQDPDQEEDAENYAQRIMAYRSSHLLFRVGRFLKGAI